jgi:superfamily II DNA or RNA helicase
METWLSQKGYAIKKRGNEALVEQLKKELTVTPHTFSILDDAPAVSFPVYRENEKKLYLPKNFGLTKFGKPTHMDIPDGEDCPLLEFAGSLRDEQRTAIENYQAAVNDPVRMGGIISLVCGGGKTVLSLYIASLYKKKTLVVCHKDFLGNQWRERIEQFLPQARIGKIKQNKIDIHNKDIVIASLQSIAMKDYDPAIFQDFGLAICDECFPGDTLIHTNWGLQKIGYLYHLWYYGLPVPDILSYNEYTHHFEFKPLTYAWQRESLNLLQVSLSNHTTINCTSNHKIYTTRGHIPASHLYPGDEVLALSGTLTVLDITEHLNTDTFVYDIEVAHNHNFILENGAIVSNCHHLSAEVFSQCLPKITARRMLGLSATLKRKDGLTKVFEWFLGKPVFTAKRTESELLAVIKRYYEPDPDYSREIKLWNGKLNVAKMINHICEYRPRNHFIVQLLQETLKEEPERRILILSERRNHLQLLEELMHQYKLPVTIGYYVGGMKQEQLDISATKQVILATFQLASEGMDIPSLNMLILASPVGSIEQAVGRIQRQKVSERKYTPLVIDIIDEFSIFEKQGWKRYTFYKANNYTIQDGKKTEGEEQPKKYVFVEDPDETN